MIDDVEDERDDDREVEAPTPRRDADGGARRALFAARTKGRELALRYLYQRDLRTDALPSFDDFALFEKARGVAVDFARTLVAGVEARRDVIDGRIKEFAKNWALHRMAAVDRNVLRIGACEMTMREPSPPGVAINEAVELAKKYGSSKSGQFVNGILDRLARSPGFLPKDSPPREDDATRKEPT